MGDTDKVTTGDDLFDEEIALCASGEFTASDVARMAREIQRRRAANRDLEAIKTGMMADIEATPEIKAALVREMATYRVMASMGVRELRWGDDDIDRLFERLSPAAREVYGRWLLSHAAAFHARTGVIMRGRLGLTSKRLLEEMRQEIDLARKHGEASLEYERIVLPEIAALIEAKERSFAAARNVESAAPLGESGVGAEALIHGNTVTSSEVTPIRTKITLTNISLYDSKDSPSVEHIGPCVLKLGKASSNHITIADPDVTRFHAAIEINHEGVVTICDMGSPFGTFVNGKPVRLQKLATGDEIKIGTSKYRVTIERSVNVPTGRHA